MINFDEFVKIELKVGTVLGAEEVEGSEKLIKLKLAAPLGNQFFLPPRSANLDASDNYIPSRQNQTAAP